MGDEREPIAKVPSYVHEIKRQLEERAKQEPTPRKPAKRAAEKAHRRRTK